MGIERVVKSVCVIGVGAIGAPIAKRIHQAGYELRVCDANEQALEPFAKSGVKVSTNASDAAGVDLALIVVASAAQVDAVITGANGIVAGLRDSPAPIIAVTSTVGPAAIRELERSSSAKGIRIIDAPVSGGVRRAELGSLSILIGGNKADIERTRPVFECLGNRLFYFGAVGQAQVVKLANNMIMCANVLASAEAYRIALEHGIVLDDLTEILESSSGRNNFSASPGDAKTSFGSWTQTRAHFESVVSLLRKDVRLAREVASGLSGEFPMLELLNSAIEMAEDETFFNWRAVAQCHGADSEDK